MIDSECPAEAAAERDEDAAAAARAEADRMEALVEELAAEKF
jgi:hypothetical protein